MFQASEGYGLGQETPVPGAPKEPPEDRERKIRQSIVLIAVGVVAGLFLGNLIPKGHPTLAFLYAVSGIFIGKGIVNIIV